MSIGTAIFLVGMGFLGLNAGGLYAFIRIWRADDARWQERQKAIDDDFEATRREIERGARRSDHRFKL